MRRHLPALLVGPATLVALVTLAPRASLATPDPAASAGITDGGVSDAGPPPPPFDADPIPTERSPAPKPDEWHTATRVSLTRNLTPCRAYRVREWMKIDCSQLSPAGIAEIAGPSEGVMLFIASPPHFHESGPDDPGFTGAARLMEVIFPLRRGAGHMFQLLELGEGYEGPESASVSLVLSDYWVDGEAPIITLH